MLHTWVETAGGPLIVVPKSELDHWAGVDHNDGPVETWGDYGRACAAEGYIGLVTVGAQQALVLGDEPAMTTYLTTERLFLRWAAAYSEAELVAAGRRALAGQLDWDDDDRQFGVHNTGIRRHAARPGHRDHSASSPARRLPGGPRRREESRQG
ncbi:Imm21 family immunity protein [Microtetraspora malaysiensis]|uniref:Imm21 family immunity protein n=1 Tax=Microtetraspora malaysiensis TaxID=161358 RepID=A0ABW6T4M4_9ACTN